MNGKHTAETVEKYAARKSLARTMREMSKEPHTVSHVTGSEITTTALEDDGVDHIESLLERTEVWRIEPCLNDITAAVEIAETVVAHPDTINTEVRICYADDDTIRDLQLLETDDSQGEAYETAVAQFISVFTEHAEGESLSIDELSDGLNCWYSNLTGNAIGPSWISRSLLSLDIEVSDLAVSDRRWADGAQILTSVRRPTGGSEPLDAAAIYARQG